MHDPDPFPGKDAANEALENGAANGEAADAATVVDGEQELQQAVARAEQYQDQFLRAKAEAENVRRRAQEDVAKAYKFAIESFAEGLLPVVDSLEKALQIEDATPQAMREGIDLTLRQLKAAFAKGNLKEIDPARRKVRPALSSGDFNGAGRRCGAESRGVGAAKRLADCRPCAAARSGYRQVRLEAWLDRFTLHRLARHKTIST